uniref:F-box domain-containing protein n=1 Tax=Triticum urartu TaxID=4572 RepID=A0A8R7VIX5_TRIUA
MARIRTDRPLRRRPRPARGDDRVSALPDDLLLLVLRRLDTRTALGTGLLSRRWGRLQRELPALDFRVSNMLPPRYHGLVFLHHDTNRNGPHCLFKKFAFMPNIMRYERRAMRALTSSVESFLDEDGARGASRSLSRLRLEFFITHNTGCMNRLIAKCIDHWGVRDLEAVARPIYFRQSVHTFPSYGLCQEPRASSLRSLKLGGCTLPPVHEFSELTMLVLQGIQKSTPTAAYEGVFTLCPQLQVLHLRSCGCPWDTDLLVDAPSSHIRELVLDKCRFRQVRMRGLPSLESLASMDTMLHFESASFPCLRQCKHTERIGTILRPLGRRSEYIGHQRELGSFLGCTSDITNLVIRFTGPRRWIMPASSSSSLLSKLRKLLVADVPSSWDVSWPRLLLEMAPSLEILHIHIAPCKEKPGDLISWQPTKLRRRTKRQIYLVRFVIGASTALRRVALFKNGHAQEKGHWDWEMVTEQHSWTDEEKDTMRKQIMDGVSFS